jgi:hypothetical protein
MKEELAHAILQPYLEKLAITIVKSFETYRTRYPHRPIHRRTTAASVICDEIWAEIVNAFDEDAPRVRPIQQAYGLRLLGVQGPSGETEILLWFKKVDGHRNPRSYPTKLASERLAGKNLEMFSRATVLIVGYCLNRDETRILSVSISRPAKGRPEWYIDLELPETPHNVVQISGSESTSTSSKRVVVRRIKQARLGEE